MADFGYARYGEDDDENEDDEEGGFRPQFNQRDGLIFLIDASKSMFEAADDDDCLFQHCLKALKITMQNKIISSERDYIGTVFFGTEKTENKNDFKHIYVYQELDQPGAQKILDVEELEQDGIKTFSKDFGHNPAFSLQDALWICQNMFAHCSQTLGSKRVLLFTSNDDPHKGNNQLKRRAATKANDLHETGIDLELMHLQNPGQHFDVSKFYKDVLYSDEDEQTELADPTEKMEELLRRVRAKDHKKRAVRRIAFNLGEGMKFSVGVYNLVRSCAKPSAIKLSKKDNAELKSHSKTFLPETGEVLMPQDLKKSQTYGSRKICFENDEVVEMKKFDPSGLYLMGFKPLSCLKKYFHVKPAQFIYPDESRIAGSTTLFTAMLMKCLDRDVAPICKYIPGRNNPPKFVVLLPQKEEVDDQKVQTIPPGFHVIFLPFADDFRKVNYQEDVPRATEDQVNKAKEIIKKLKFDFNSEDFENPVLQNHWRNIEALALQRDELEELVDHTLPPVEALNKRAGQTLNDFKDMVFPADYVPGQKRKAPSADAAAKKAKTEEALVSLDIKKEAQAKRLGKLTVAILKDIIKKEKITTAATRKNDLIDAIENHFGV